MTGEGRTGHGCAAGWFRLSKWLVASGAAVHIRAGTLRGPAVLRCCSCASPIRARSKSFASGRSIFSRCIKPRDADVTARRHCRYRRGKPAKARPMAVAANARRRHDHAADQARRRGDRLRRRLLRAGPAVAGAGRGRLSRSRRRDAEQASRPAEQRPGHGRRDAAVAGGAGPDRPAAPSSRNPTSNCLLPEWRRSAAIRSRFVYEFPGLLRNIPILENAAAGRGVFSIRTERDGIVRRVPMVVQAQGNVVPSLSFEMLRVATGASTILVRMDAAGIKGVALPGFEMPTDRNGQLWIHFAPHDQARYVSALDVLEGRVARRPRSRRLGPDRHLGGRAARSEDDADRSGHAWRRGSRPGAGEHPVQLACCRRQATPSSRSWARRSCSASRSSCWRRSCRPIDAAAVRRSFIAAAGRRRPGICSRNKSC